MKPPMMSRLRKLISLTNVVRAHASGIGGMRGQIATLMLLMIVAVLIFVLMTANLGQVSLSATRLANAADSSSLLLGSQLATKARVLGESLGSHGSPKTQKCTSAGGFLSTLIAIIVAIIAIVLQQYEILPFLAMGFTGTAAAMAAGAIGGAVGGAIGGGITGGGMGALMGAIQGAVTGAALGAGVGGGMAQGAGVAGSEGAVVTLGDTLVEETITTVVPAFSSISGSTFGAATGATVLSGATPLIAGSTLAGAGATAGGISSAGSSLYTASVMDQMREDAIAAAGKKLSGLPEYDRIRENVVFRALVQTVDDPTKVPDNDPSCPDSDEDGNTTEMVPFFQVWWACRAKGLHAVVPVLTNLTQNFLNGPLSTFEDSAKAAYSAGGTLSRQDAGFEGVDGPVVEVARALTGKGLDLKFWKPGPDTVALDAWQKADCETCQPPAGFDEVDFAIETFHDIVEVSSGKEDVADDGLRGQPIDRVVSTWQTWLKLFYNPAASERGDFYEVLDVLVNGGNADTGGVDVTGMKAWKTEIEDTRKQLPVCAYDFCDPTDPNATCVPGEPVSVQNPLCRGDGAVRPLSWGTIDTDLADEFAPAQQALDTLIGDITAFRDGIKNFSDDMEAASTQLNISGGVNPVTYGSLDSRGSHSVKVEVGPFKVAWIKKKTSGSFLKKKICLILRDYSDGGGNTWVKVTRQDPSNKGIGFWTWNPHGGTTTKISRASYSFDSVGIAGTK